MPCPAMSGAEPWTGSNRPGVPGWSGATLALAAMPMPPCSTAARSVRMSPKRFEATTTSQALGVAHHARAERVDQHALVADAGEVGPAPRPPPRPRGRSRTGGVALGRRRQDAAAASPASSNAWRMTRSQPCRVKTAVSRGLVAQPLVRAPAAAGVLALGVLAHEDHVDVGAGAAGQRTGRLQQPRGADVRPQVEALADGQDQLPAGEVIGHRRVRRTRP